MNAKHSAIEARKNATTPVNVPIEKTLPAESNYVKKLAADISHIPLPIMKGHRIAHIPKTNISPKIVAKSDPIIKSKAAKTPQKRRSSTPPDNTVVGKRANIDLDYLLTPPSQPVSPLTDTNEPNYAATLIGSIINFDVKYIMGKSVKINMLPVPLMSFDNFNTHER